MKNLLRIASVLLASVMFVAVPALAQDDAGRTEKPRKTTQVERKAKAKKKSAKDPRGVVANRKKNRPDATPGKKVAVQEKDAGSDTETKEAPSSDTSAASDKDASDPEIAAEKARMEKEIAAITERFDAWLKSQQERRKEVEASGPIDDPKTGDRLKAIDDNIARLHEAKASQIQSVEKKYADRIYAIKAKREGRDPNPPKPVKKLKRIWD